MEFDVIKFKSVHSTKNTKDYTIALLTLIDNDEVIYVRAFFTGILSESDIKSYELRKKGYYYCLVAPDFVYDLTTIV